MVRTGGRGRDILGVTLTDNLSAFVERKLFTLNTGHAPRRTPIEFRSRVFWGAKGGGLFESLLIPRGGGRSLLGWPKGVFLFENALDFLTFFLTPLARARGPEFSRNQMLTIRLIGGEGATSYRCYQFRYINGIPLSTLPPGQLSPPVRLSRVPC